MNIFSLKFVILLDLIMALHNLRIYYYLFKKKKLEKDSLFFITLIGKPDILSRKTLLLKNFE